MTEDFKENLKELVGILAIYLGSVAIGAVVFALFFVVIARAFS